MKKEKNTEKALDKMTAKELRDIATGLPNITGAHGMNKQDLLNAVRAARGIAALSGKSADFSVKKLKEKIADLKNKKKIMLSNGNSKGANLLRKKISRMKKKTRKSI